MRGRTPLFRVPYLTNRNPNYDVSRDGTRFVVVPRRADANRVVVALHVLEKAGPAAHR